MARTSVADAVADESRAPVAGIAGGAGSGRRRGVPQDRLRALLAALPIPALLVAVATILLRAINLGRSWDIFVDEISYLRLSQSVAQDLTVKLYGGTFYLHPPAFFFVQAGWLRLLRPSGPVIEQVYAVRPLVVLLAAASAVLLYSLARRLGGPLSAAAAAVIFALDPYVIRTNSRDMLETPALFWVLAGYALVFPAIPSGDPRGHPPFPAWRALAAGVAFGLAVLTKDMMVFLTLLPLAICFALNWALPRRATLLVAAVAVATYLPYLLIIMAVGEWGRFGDQKLRGLYRFLGLVKESGFKRQGGPSLTRSILANLDQFGTTYVLLGAGLVALVILLLHGDRAQRLLLAWATSAYVLLAYSIGFGTIEEQFFYFLTVPCILATSVSVAIILRLGRPADRWWRPVRLLLAFAGIVFVSWTAFAWLRTHTTPDNGYERARAYLDANVPIGSRIAVTTEPAVFLMDGYESGSWATIEEVQGNRAEYVLVSTKEIISGLGYARPDFYDWLIAHGEVVFRFRGRTNGDLLIYRLSVSDGMGQRGYAIP